MGYEVKNLDLSDQGEKQIEFAEMQMNGSDAVRNVWEVWNGTGWEQQMGESTNASDNFSIIWDSHTVLDGVYTIRVEMYDAAGNSGTDNITIIVDNEELMFMSSDKELDPQYDIGVWVKSKFFVDALNAMFEDSLK